MNNNRALEIVQRANSSTLARNPKISFSRTKRIVRSGAKHAMIFAAVTGIESFLPMTFLPGLVIQLCLGAPNMYNAVKQGRPQLVLSRPPVTMFWYITFKGLSGLREAYIISQRSTLFTPITNAVSGLMDKHLRGANSNSAKYKIFYVIAMFIRAYLQIMKYPVYDNPHNYARRFASTYSGHVGRHMMTALKFGMKKAGNYPIVTATAISAGAAYIRAKTMKRRTNNSPRRTNNSPRRTNNSPRRTNNSPRRLTSGRAN